MTKNQTNIPNWRFSGNEKNYVDEVLANGFRAGSDGSMNERFERLFAEMIGISHAISFNSGTSTLHASLLALGTGPDSEVIIPALSPFMCGSSVVNAGATPVFADVDWNTFLISPYDLQEKITQKTKAIMAVHLYGQVCPMEAIMEIAKDHDLSVVEDCAQCFLGFDSIGRLGGTIGDVGSWSYESSKHLSSGEGGIIACADENLAMEIRKIGALGFKNMSADSGKIRTSREKLQDPEWTRHDRIGFNFRMSEITAAVALAQTERMRDLVDLRIEMGKDFLNVLKSSELLRPQETEAGAINSYYTFAARFDGIDHGLSWRKFRETFMAFGGDGIYAAWVPIGREPAFAEPGIGWGEAPVAEKLQGRLMQFTTNQENSEERKIQVDALLNTLKTFGDNI
jgi:perosamine synthetase